MDEVSEFLMSSLTVGLNPWLVLRAPPFHPIDLHLLVICYCLIILTQNWCIRLNPVGVKFRKQLKWFKISFLFFFPLQTPDILCGSLWGLLCFTSLWESGFWSGFHLKRNWNSGLWDKLAHCQIVPDLGAKTGLGCFFFFFKESILVSKDEYLLHMKNTWNSNLCDH